jgi:hypothetical protein
MHAASAAAIRIVGRRTSGVRRLIHRTSIIAAG